MTVSGLGKFKENESQGLEVGEAGFSIVANPTILQWSCRMRESKGIHLLPFRLCIFFAGAFALSISIYKDLIEVPGDDGFLLFFFLPVSFFLSFFVAAIEQKTVYNYAVSAERGACESYHYFPSWAGAFFKSTAVVVLLGFFGVAIMSGSFLPLLGAGALGLGYAGRLLGWENEIKFEESAPWDEYKFITLDNEPQSSFAHNLK